MSKTRAARIVVTRAGPLATFQDAGRFGALSHGVSASGPMDRCAFHQAGGFAETAASSGIEITSAGLDFEFKGFRTRLGFAGGQFAIARNGTPMTWPGATELADGDTITVHPGPSGNYGYLRFDRELDVPILIGSRATNLVAGLGGFEGRALQAGDNIELAAAAGSRRAGPKPPSRQRSVDAPIRFIWGLHADLFEANLRAAFCSRPLIISHHLDRMGVRLNDPNGVFSGQQLLSLASDAVVAGDVQVLGDGAPIVLMRDHQPTGGYPRIATIITADLDRFAQLRPGTEIGFAPVSVARAGQLLKRQGAIR